MQIESPLKIFLKEVAIKSIASAPNVAVSGSLSHIREKENRPYVSDAQKQKP